MSGTDELIVAYLEDALDEPGLRRLEDLLRGDAGSRARFARLCRDDLLLRQSLRTMAPGSPRCGSPAHGVRARRPARRPSSAGRAWPLAAATALLVAVAGWLVGRQGAVEAPAPVVAVPGAAVAELLRADRVGSGGRALEAGTRVPAGQAVEVADGGAAVLRFLADGSEVSLAGGTVLRLAEDGLQARLVRGRLEARVRPQGGGRFAIAAPQATATVVGTRFVLEADGPTTRLAVSEGVVRFSAANGDAVQVAAGANVEAGASGLLGAVHGFTLVDAARGTPMRPSTLGALAIATAELPTGGVNLRAECAAGVHSIRIGAKGPRGRVAGVVDVEREVPFTIAGDNEGRFRSWHPSPGTYLLTVQPCSDEDGKRPLGDAATLTLTILP